MGSLTAQQVEGFYKYGFLKVDGVLDPEEYLDPIIDEYSGVLDRLADELYDKGEIKSRYEDLPFGDRVTAIYAETGKQFSGYFDFSLPFMGVTEETPVLDRASRPERADCGAIARRRRVAYRIGNLLQSGAARTNQAA